MFRRNGLFVAVLILTFPSFCCAQGVLLTAKAIAAEKYADWTYGSATADKQIDCVQRFLFEGLPVYSTHLIAATLQWV